MTVVDETSSKHHIVNVKGMTVILTELNDILSQPSTAQLPHRGILKCTHVFCSEKMADCMVHSCTVHEVP